MTQEGITSEVVSAVKAGAEVKTLIVLLHASDSTPEIMSDLLRPNFNTLDDVCIVAPRGHIEGQVIDERGGQTFRWYDFETLDKAGKIVAVRDAAEVLGEYLDRKLEEFRLTNNELVIVGFSQGAMVGLYHALRRAEPCAAVVSIAGMLVGLDNLADEIQVKPSVLTIHGTRDTTIPLELGKKTEAALAALGVPVTPHHIDAGHSVGTLARQIALEHVKGILSNSLGKKR